jgi:predicted nucleic acid-binding protein
MSRVFADTHFYIAVLSRRDAAHEAARAVLSSGEFSQMIRHFQQAGFQALLA